MASQYRKVSGVRTNSLLRDAEANRDARIAMLPQLMARQQEQQLIKRDTAFQNKQISLAKDQAKQRLREQEAAMGQSAMTLGTNIAMSDMNKTTFGDIKRGTTNMFKPAGERQQAPTGGDTGFNAWRPGTAISSGLTGFGVGKMVGGKSKVKKGLFGAASGGILGLLSGQGLGGGITGLVSGGIGGLLS